MNYQPFYCQLIRLSFLIFLLNPIFLFAQSGPGGVGSTNGASDLKLWLDANQLDFYANDDPVAIWYDRSGYDNTSLQATASRQPLLKTNFLNGQSVLSFDGTDDYMNGGVGTINAPLTIFSIGYFDNANQGLDNNDYIFSLGGQTSGAGVHTSISRRKNDNPPDQDKYYAYDAEDPIFGPVLSGMQWTSITQVHNNAVPFHGVYIDGVQATPDDYVTALTTDGVYRVGGWVNNDHNHLQGDVAEIVVYDKVLNSAEINIVHSYLSAKYDLTLTGDQYTGDDVSNGNYDFDVAGIGLESDGGNTDGASVGVTISQNANFQVGDYVMFGHNALANSLNTSDVGHATLTIDERWERTWWVDITDNGAAVVVDLEFDMSDSGLSGRAGGDASNYKLLYRAGTSGNWTDIASASSHVDDEILFSAVSLTADGHYAIGTVDNTNSSLGMPIVTLGNDGPGGIGSADGTSNLELWLDADDVNASDDDAIASWLDASGNNNNAFQSISGREPVFKTNVINENPVLRFDGANDYLTGTLTQGNLNAPATLVAVAYFDNVTQASGDHDYVVAVGFQSGNSHTNIGRRDNEQFFSYSGSSVLFGPSITGQQWDVYSQLQNTSSTYHELYVNGTSQTVTDYTGSLTASGAFRVGSYSNAQHFLDGDVAEVILFDRVLNSAELNILHSYLSGKNGVAVADDKYTGDDMINGDHDMDIAGVGTEADGSNAAASSAGLRVSQNSGFEVGDYLVFGHATETNALNTSDAGDPSGSLESRWERVWWMDVTDPNSSLVVDIDFDFSESGAGTFPDGLPSDYKLLHRTGTSGDWTVLASGSSFNDDWVSFTGVSLSSDGYYALGTFDQLNSPLPVELIGFYANRLGNGSIQLNWETATELNNAGFYIERAFKDDINHFVTLGFVEGRGNTNDNTQYVFVDETAGDDKFYYRLKQVDLDDSHSYSSLVAVEEVNRPFFCQISPNPVARGAELKIATDLSTDKIEVSIADMMGKVVLSAELNDHQGESILTLTEELPAGLYLVTIVSGDYKYFERLLIG